MAVHLCDRQYVRALCDTRGGLGGGASAVTIGSGGLQILDSESGLPTLPCYYINLYQAAANPSPIAIELAKHITQSFGLRYPKAA